MTYNPNFVPTGVNNRLNEYYKTWNNVKIPRSWETRAMFLGGTSVIVDGGAINTFTRNDVEYTQIVWGASGSFYLSGNLVASLALVGGGANGGRSNTYTWIAAGGGAGGCIIEVDTELTAGNYLLEIGAGAPPANDALQVANGSSSTLTFDGGTITAVGGGYGASHGGAASPAAGGSGGGSRGGASGVSTPANGTAGQGNAGGSGIISATLAEQAGGGGGGAGSPGGDATAGVAGEGGAGRQISFMSSSFSVCRGGDGCVYDAELPVVSSDDALLSGGFGSGSGGSMMGTAGAGAQGLFVIVFRSADARVLS